jgi:outer membrane protein assembly factor BamB
MKLKSCALPTRRTILASLFLVVLTAILMTGCAGEHVCRYTPSKPIFFPPAPDEPHIQYLTGINSSDDIGTTKKQSSFSLVVTGQERPDVIKKLGKAYGITTYNGKIYLAEGMNARISIIDLAAGTIDYPPGVATPRGALKYPVNVALDDEGYIYVADTARREIVVYDPAGNFSTSFHGTDPKSKVVDVKIYKGKLFALDLGMSRIRILNRKTGEQLDEMGFIEKPDQSLRVPTDFFIDAAGNIYVTNVGNNKVIKYDQDGNYIGSFGGLGDQLGLFAKPKGITVDDSGLIYVVDGGTNVVQLFDDQFRLLTYFGWPGLPYGSLNGPAGIVTSKENLDYFQKFAAPGFKVERLVYVVSQFGQEYCIPRISVYGIGQMQK